MVILGCKVDKPQFYMLIHIYLTAWLQIMYLCGLRDSIYVTMSDI